MKCWIGFSTGNAFTSKAIRFFRKAEYSHTFEIVGELSGDKMCVEAIELGVWPRPLHKHVDKSTKMELWEIEVDEDLFHQAVRNALSRAGHAYGFLQLIGFIWVWLWKLVCVTKGNPFHDGIICSEEVLMFLKDCGYKAVLDMPNNTTAPDDILRVFRACPKAKKIAEKDYGTDALSWLI
jgi:hypothetical protein